MSAPFELRVADVSEMLGVSIGTVRRWTDMGLLKSTRSPGGQRRYSRDDVDAFVRAQMGGDGVRDDL